MKRGVLILPIVVACATVLIGCSDLRQRAEARIAAVEDTAGVAAQAAAANTARILELQDRVETLERRLDELREPAEEP